MTCLGVGLLALPAAAQPPAEPGTGGPPPADPAMKQKLLDAFDTNQDGNIDRAERQAIRRAMIENFGPGRPGGPGPGGRGPQGRRRPDGPPPGGPPGFGEGQGPERRRGQDDRGPEGRRGRGPDGPPGPPHPERLFGRFDENKDDALSRDEFKKLTDWVHEHRLMGPPREWRDGQRFDRRGPDGPPRGEFRGRGPEGRRGWWRQGPPGPPPGPEGPPPPADGPPPESGPPEDAI
jgi:hypothetical protein